MGKNTIQIVLNYTFYRFFCMISFVFQVIWNVGRTGLFLFFQRGNRFRELKGLDQVLPEADQPTPSICRIGGKSTSRGLHTICVEHAA